MKKNKAFTLIELLAVIIILAIIALISTPIIINVIEDARKEGFKQTALGYYNAANYIYNEMFMDSKTEDVQFTFDKGNQVSSNSHYKLETKGEVPKEGIVYLSKDGYINVTIHNNKYCASTRGNGQVNITEDIENCLKEGVYQDNSGANKPQLVDKLIPVVYEDNTWKVVSPYNKWYDYDNKEWANAIVLENNITKNVGDTLNIDTEVAQMYVWIPRYEYSIPEHNIGRTDSDIHAIGIKFVDTSITQANIDSGYNMHPGFKFGEDEVSGLWVGKFETTGENKDSQTEFTCENENCTQKITIKTSYRAAYGKVSSQFYATRSIEKQYGLSNIDSHMAKYTEWTAISYLTNSIYGRCSDSNHCTEVTINNSNSYGGGYTGNAGNSISDAAAELKIYNTYDTIQGMTASTTGNITGVYDMSGGMLEYVMGVTTNTSELLENPGYFYDLSGFSSTMDTGAEDLANLPESKYYDSFKTDGTESFYDSLIVVNGIDGDYRGIFKELLNPETCNMDTTLQWYGDSAGSIGSGSPWFVMGGFCNQETFAGVFFSDPASGETSDAGGFRVVLVMEK